MDTLTRSLKSACAFALLALCARATPVPSWSLLENGHFQVYSEGSCGNCRNSLLWFEQLRAFFAQSGFQLDGRPPVRVIGFASVADYNSYRLHRNADAYYVGTESRDYIVLPALDPSRFGVAAHEYAHLVLHAAGLGLPAWLNEGFAEVFSTVRISDTHCEFGGEIRSHTQLLRAHSWLPLPRVLSTGPDALTSRDETNLFYAQSWAFTDLLLTSPEYSARFPELTKALASGQPSAAALESIYGKSLEAIASDLRRYFNGRPLRPISAAGLSLDKVSAITSELTPFAAQTVLADLLLASGELNSAERLYLDLAHESPGNPEIAAALGTIALRRGDRAGAQVKWKEALDEGITDSSLCYRYAVLADESGVPENEIRPALERAIELNPSLDDARFKLAMFENNAAHYAEALRQLSAMHSIAPERKFSYWLTTAYAQDQLAMHAESKLSAQKALGFAVTERERTQATELAYVADTELTVEFTRDSAGNPQMTTTRVPRGTQSWNPFVEPQDRMRRAEGHLSGIECGASDKITGVDVETSTGSLRLSIPNPQHVLIRGVNEFTCGPQPARPVTVEYAASADKSREDGILRGMEVKAK